MGKKHKKHKKHESRYSPSAYQEDDFLREVEQQSGVGGSGKMKVILKLSSSKQKNPKQLQPEPPTQPTPLIVSISRLYLRPPTPTSVDVEEMDTVIPSFSSSSSFLKTDSKQHKPKKHKKHKKTSSHDTQQPSLQTLTHHIPSGSSPASHLSSQGTPHAHTTLQRLQPVGRSHSGKQLANIVSEHIPVSPFKFTFSKEMIEHEEEEEEEEEEGEEPCTYTPTPPTSSHLHLHHERKSHKHKKHHRHHHRPHTSSLDSEEVIGGLVNPSPSVLPSLSGKHMGSSPWLSGGEESTGGRLSTQQSHDSVYMSHDSIYMSQDSMQESPGVRELSVETLRDLELQVVDEDSSRVQPSHMTGGESTLSKPHKKKKDKKKKKHKHLQHDREISPVLPILPPNATPPFSSVATPTQHKSPSPALSTPAQHISFLQKLHEPLGRKRRYTSDDSIPASPVSKKMRHTSPPREYTSSPNPLEPASVTPSIPLTKKSSPIEMSSHHALPRKLSPQPPFKTPTPPQSVAVHNKPKKDPAPRTGDLVPPPKKLPTPTKTHEPSPPSVPNISPPPAVKLSSNTLKFFVKNIHHLIQKRDPEGIFVEPVTDDIAPGYSAIISNPMDLTTMATKVEASMYTSVQDFKADFILMCNNAMTYNAPETVYYVTAKRLLSSGLQIIAKETSLRPDMKHGRVHTETAGVPLTFSASSLPPAAPHQDFSLPPPSNASVDYESDFLCSLPLRMLQPHRLQPQTCGAIPESVGVVTTELDSAADQRHLTRVVVGVEEEEEEEEEEEGREDVMSHYSSSSVEQILQQVEGVASMVKENLDINKPGIKCCFLNQNPSGKTVLNILNPDTAQVDSSKPVDLSVLHDRVRMGQNAATVLATELPMMRATPVSYLMYGPFGSFAPVYDSAFATLSKMDSDLLLSSYGSDLGVSYAHSLQNFVRGAGGFVSEMATAVLNGLTNNRHSTFMQKLSAFEDKETKKPQDKATRGSSPEAGGGVKPVDAKETGETGDEEGSGSRTLKASPVVKVESKEVEEIGETGSLKLPKSESECGSADRVSGSSRGSQSREVSLERSNSSEVSSVQFKCGEFGFERSRSSEPGVENKSRELILERSSSREVSIESAHSRDASLEQSKSEEINLTGSKCSSLSREVSTERSSLVDASTDRPNSKEPGDIAMETHTSFSVDAKLKETSSLLAVLHTRQDERLSRPPYESSSGHLMLYPPTKDELGVAKEIRQKLASLTAMVSPEDVVSVDALHDAMGVSVTPFQSSPWNASTTATRPVDSPAATSPLPVTPRDSSKSSPVQSANTPVST